MSEYGRILFKYGRKFQKVRVLKKIRLPMIGKTDFFIGYYIFFLFCISSYSIILINHLIKLIGFRKIIGNKRGY